MRHRGSGALAAVVILIGGIGLPGCVLSEAKCNQACIDTFRTWVKRGGVGTPPAAGLPYCKVHPDDPFCPN